MDLEGAVRNALGQRTDLRSTKKNLETSDITIRSLENQTMPQLDFIGQLNLAGRAGIGIPQRDPITGDDHRAPGGGYIDALRGVGAFDAPTWNVRLQFSYPIGTSAQRRPTSRVSGCSRSRPKRRLKATELQIATEVTAAALAVRNSLEAMQAATGVARAVRSSGSKRRRQVRRQGMATNFEVVQAQRDLNDARNSELRQQLNYQRALVDFQRVQITR